MHIENKKIPRKLSYMLPLVTDLGLEVTRNVETTCDFVLGSTEARMEDGR